LLNTETGRLKIWRELSKLYETAMVVEMQRHVHNALENTSEGKIWRGKIFVRWKSFKLLPKKNWLIIIY